MMKNQVKGQWPKHSCRLLIQMNIMIKCNVEKDGKLEYEREESFGSSIYRTSLFCQEYDETKTATLSDQLCGRYYPPPKKIAPARPSAPAVNAC